MAAPVTSILDSFGRADGAPGSNWAVAIQTYPVPAISGNALSWPQFPSAYWTPSTFAADQEIFLKTTGTALYGVLLRLTSPGGGSESCYRVMWRAGAASYESEAWRLTTGLTGVVSLGYANSVVATTDTYFWVSVVGTAITLYGSSDGSTWTQRKQWTDSAISGAGYIGLFQQNNSVGTTSIDDVGGGSMVTVDDCLPDADVTTTGWATAPLFSKVNDASDATVITATSV